MRVILKILTFLAAVLVCGALLSPPLFWLGQWLAHEGIIPILAKFPFQKYFNRSLLISAIVLLWPFGRWLGIRVPWGALLVRCPEWRRQTAGGFATGAFVMTLLAVCYVWGGFYGLKASFERSILIRALVSACFVGILEEWLFRGVIMRLLTHALPPARALGVCSALFAAVHFLKPNPAVQITEVHWQSGWVLVPEMFHQFAKPLLVLGGFGTLCVFGWVLGLAALRTGSLWMAIGLHAGVVYIKLVFSKMYENKNTALPWVGSELQIGMAPIALLLLTGLFVWSWTKNRARENTP
jgi:membrane protease YdiL (CAAX protease family)